MRNLKGIIALGMGLLLTATACDDEASSIGSSLINDQVEIVVDSAYTLTGRSVLSSRLQSRTTLQLLGDIDAREYGRFHSDFVTQFMPSETLDLTGVDVENVDSCHLIMRMPKAAAVGDSLAPMGLTVYRLNDQLQVPIYSDFDVAGKYDSTPLGSTFYTLTTQPGDTTKFKALNANVHVDLGRYFALNLIKEYQESPKTFTTPETFAKWFPGVYVTTTFGSGRVVQVDSTVITMYYRQRVKLDEGGKNERDTLYNRSASYLAVTPEVISNNNFSYKMAESLRSRAEAGEPIIVAPIGYDVEITFPTREIINSYKANAGKLAVINTLSFTLPVDEIVNDYGLTPPPYVLMVKTSEKDNFFLKSRLPDQLTSFYAEYDSYSGTYVFSDMRQYILSMLEKGENITEDDMNFSIVPVTIAFEQANSNNNLSYYYYYYYGVSNTSTKTVVSSVVPYVHRPAMGLLRPDKSQIVFTYASHSLDD